VQRCRSRALHYLNEETARIAGLQTPMDLEQFCTGQITLEDSNLRALARHMGLAERPAIVNVKQAAA
jgi:hypothetical protein